MHFYRVHRVNEERPYERKTFVDCHTMTSALIMFGRFVQLYEDTYGTVLLVDYTLDAMTHDMRSDRDRVIAWPLKGGDNKVWIEKRHQFNYSR